MDTSFVGRQEINPVRRLVHQPGLILLVMLVIHPFLVLSMRYSEGLSTVHALVTLLIGIWLALFSSDPRKAGYAAAYITGAEVLWRMTEAHVFWEFGKYAVALILLIALLKNRHWKMAAAPVLYVLLLLPSSLLTIDGLGFTEMAREEISFNLSGPLAVMICILYFRQVNFDRQSFITLLWWIVIPSVGILVLAVARTLMAEQIYFTLESNVVTSGGYGPNQVSAALGLAGALLILLSLELKGLGRLFALVLAIAFLVQATLTFSRGGVFNAIVMIGLAAVHLVGVSRRRNGLLIVLGILALIGTYMVLPRLQAFTGDVLSQRFTDYDPAARAKIASAEIELWMQNPLLGVGPGMAKFRSIDILGFKAVAHTEYTRVLAEHGLAGALAFLLLVVMLFRCYRHTPDVEWRAWIAALAGWAFAEMSHAAMRIVAISFLLGLIFALGKGPVQQPDSPFHLRDHK